MDVTELSHQLACSRQDKLECMDVLRVLCDMAGAVEAGERQLLPRLVPKGNQFFKTCVTAALESSRRDLAKMVLTGYLLADEVKGKELLRRLLIVHGLLLILNGTGPDDLAYALQGWFGTAFREDYWARLSEQPDICRTRTRSVWPAFDTLGEASMPFVVRLTYEVSASTLAMALLGAGVEVRDRIMEGISTREKRETICGLMESLAQAKTSDMEEAQRWICAYSQKLMEQCPEF